MRSTRTLARPAARGGRTSPPAVALGALLALAAVAVTPTHADAQAVTYTMTGGAISGQLGEYTFTNAIWTLSATINPSSQTEETVGAAVYRRLIAPSTAGSSHRHPRSR
jgi:hypothetical protein